jgi:Caspase domain/Domain of unknown function (DUF4384)
MKRRNFLHIAGSTLATVGLTQLDIIQQGNEFAQVMAQNTGRKLALLVGINKYTNSEPLRGCVNDVLLQKHLLIHRFGFNPQDIKILLDGDATRRSILTAFEQHLIDRAKPGDTVVFHFSGHGSRIEDPDKDEPDGLNSTLVPIDSGYKAGGGVVQDIMGHTLFLLMYALKTDNVTVVLDSCYSGGAKRGNLTVRSRNGGKKYQPSADELSYQKQWLKRLNLSPQEFIKLRRQNIAKGVAIASARSEQLATDVPLNGYHAGAFTYSLTQYLWQQTSNLSVDRIIGDVGRSTSNLANIHGYIQNPQVNINNRASSNPPIFFTFFNTSAAEAVVTKVRGDIVELWLGGIDTRTLEAFDREAILVTVTNGDRETGIVKLESRDGLVGRGKFIAPARGNSQIQAGTILQERIRGIPQNLRLKIGLDDEFDGNTLERVRQALQIIDRVTPLSLRQEEIHYIFGSMTESRYRKFLKNRQINLPVVGSLGLFLPSLEGIVLDSFGMANESVRDGIKRLQPKFKSLLATRIVREIIGNNNTSLLKVTVAMGNVKENRIIARALPTRGILKQNYHNNYGGTTGSATKTIPTVKDHLIPKIPVGSSIAFTIENQELVPIYVSILVIDAGGNMNIIFPNNWSAGDEEAILPAKAKRIIPDQDSSFQLEISEPFGVEEALIIASTSPLRNTLKAIEKIATRGNISRGTPIPTNNDEFLNISESLLVDLDAIARGGMGDKRVQLATGVRGLDVKKLAAIAIGFEVVAKV